VNDKKEKVNKDIKYNKTGREPLFRVEIVKGDTPEAAKEMRNMKAALLNKSKEDNQSLKQTVTDMYRHAEATGFFDKKDL
jgi:precorrin-6B methylase 2